MTATVTLEALRRTDKGKLNYNSHLEELEENLLSCEIQVGPRFQCLSLRDVGPVLSGRHSPPLTVNTLITDSDSEDEADISTSHMRSSKYYLDADNTQPCATDNTTLYTEPHDDEFTQSSSSEAAQPKQAPACTDSSNDAKPRSQMTPPRDNKSTYSALNCSSPETVALAKLEETRQRNTQAVISEKHSAIKNELGIIEQSFVQMMTNLKLDRQVDEMKREEFWERQIAESDKARDFELAKIKAKSHNREQLINAEIAKVKQEQQVIIEQRAQQKAEEERKLLAKQQLIELCNPLFKSITEVYSTIQEVFSSPLLEGQPDLESSFMAKNRELAADIWRKVLNYREKITANTPHSLRSCLGYLHDVADKVTYQLEVVQERLDAKQKHVERQRQQLQEQQQQEQQQQKEQARLIEEKKQQQQLQQQQHAQKQQQKPTTQPQVTQPQQQEEKQLLDVPTYQDCLEEFLRLDGVVKNANDAGKQLSANPQTKRLKLGLQKAVTLTVNSISAQSGRALKKKVQFLQDLMGGKTVTVGTDSVTTHGLPEAIMFCKNLTAKKFVDQADSQVSSNPKTAFPYAAVMISLMNSDSELKDLILGYFYIQCPYLIPYYPAKQPSQNTEDYFGSLGYKVVNGVVEKQDQFMKRMSGLCKLYSSLLISQAVGGEANTSLNIDNAWRWLARTINLQPRPTITATMIEAVLSVCSGRLVSVYGNQTVKLLVSLQNAYMPRLRSITDLETDGGAAEKLALYLAELSESAQPTREPEGFLGRGFWYS